jgi:hypothetical protein
MAAFVKVFGCRPFIEHCCPPGQSRRSKTFTGAARRFDGAAEGSVELPKTFFCGIYG